MRTFELTPFEHVVAVASSNKPAWTLCDNTEVRFTNVGHRQWIVTAYDEAYDALNTANFPLDTPIAASRQELAQLLAAILGCSPRSRRYHAQYAIGNTNFAVYYQDSGWHLTVPMPTRFPINDCSKTELIVTNTVYNLKYDYEKQHGTTFPTRSAAVEQLCKWYADAEATVAQSDS